MFREAIRKVGFDNKAWREGWVRNPPVKVSNNVDGIFLYLASLNKEHIFLYQIGVDGVTLVTPSEMGNDLKTDKECFSLYFGKGKEREKE